MKKLSLLLLILIGVSACSTKESNLVVNTNIKGLKKGTVYLQKIKDTLLVNVDSVEINGNSEFVLEAYIESPQMMYLSLDKVDNSEFDDRLDFFADKGEVSIVTSLEKFEEDAKIVGSRNQEKLIEYRKIQKRFNDSNLDLIKESFEAEKDGDEDRLMEIDEKYENLLRRRYLYTVNYAINNKDLEIAPYLALSEVFDANIKYLDTIYSSLDKNVQKSFYGKELKNFLEERREQEKKEDEITQENTESEQE
ncbi:MAG: DUF4369 domain-containing protein [Salegentibacter sp.]|uniref:DUF4369 domain-containing protein n=1 Tax=Salegentibacter flavus TaxID=287099 RepID=A0A1I4Y806_9FLAO|nr:MULTISPECIES: DUF4369 domain-containing protein [Salegentibacter]MDR9456894.1 DUF4369 domain-containing protein [Salegentibacter sp.]SFN34161.1 protein of unknown function [Salegentibacter flavus]